MGSCGSSSAKTGAALEKETAADTVPQPREVIKVSMQGIKTPTVVDAQPFVSDTTATLDSLAPHMPKLGPPSKRVSDDGRRGSKAGGGRRLSRRNSTRRRSSAGSEGGVGSWFHWDIFGGKVFDDDMGVPVSEELGLYFEWAETRVKCYDTHARRVAMKSHRLWKNEYKVRSDTRMTFRVRRFDGIAGELTCGWHIIGGSVPRSSVKASITDVFSYVF